MKNILAQPSQEWRVIDNEPSTASGLYTSYIIPLAAIGPVASIIGLSIFGITTYTGTYRVSLMSAIAQAVVGYVMSLAAVYVLALVIDALAPTFRGAKSNIQALKVAAYSSTAAWVCGIFNLVPAISFLQILSLYSLYLLYLGLPVLMKSPEDKALGYTVVVVLVAILIFAVIGAVSSLFVAYPVPTMTPPVPRAS